MTSKKAWLIGVGAILVLVLVAGPIGRSLINGQGGRAKDRPWTSIAVRDATVIRTGHIPRGQPLAFDVVNHTGSTKTYVWRAATRGNSYESGQMTIRSGGIASASATTSRAAAGGRVTISLEGETPRLVIRVGPSLQ